MAVRVDLAERLVEAAKRLPPDRRRAVVSAIEKFSQSPDLPSLKFRALKAHPSAFIINARRGDRVILLKRGVDHYEAADCGPHDNVYRIWNR